jgi:hypothetical protein
MYTSFVLVALTGLAAAPSANIEGTAWVTDYAAAYAQGQKEKKPLAVVFGSGKAGADALCKDGTDKEILEAMKTAYIPVYIDMDREAGKKLAEEFKVSAGPALVLTDRDLDNIALRHKGAVAKAELLKGLKRYAEPERVVQATETDITAEVRFYPSATPAATSSSIPSYTPAYAPGYTPGYAPAYGPVYGGFGGGCAGGRCR